MPFPFSANREELLILILEREENRKDLSHEEGRKEGSEISSEKRKKAGFKGEKKKLRLSYGKRREEKNFRELPETKGNEKGLEEKIPPSNMLAKGKRGGGEEKGRTSYLTGYLDRKKKGKRIVQSTQAVSLTRQEKRREGRGSCFSIGHLQRGKKEKERIEEKNRLDSAKKRREGRKSPLLSRSRKRGRESKESVLYQGRKASSPSPKKKRGGDLRRSFLSAERREETSFPFHCERKRGRSCGKRPILYLPPSRGKGERDPYLSKRGGKREGGVTPRKGPSDLTCKGGKGEMLSEPFV